jgi:aspartyl-tRNA(Asn)/glutamyl-tRNA(Gln) amidotransferase subunit A
MDGVPPLSTHLVPSAVATVRCCDTGRDLSGDDDIMRTADTARAAVRPPLTLVLDDMDAQVSGAFRAAVAKLASAGAQIDEIDVPELRKLRRSTPGWIHRRRGLGARGDRPRCN